VKAVFLDRDGTINKLVHRTGSHAAEGKVAPWEFVEFEYIDGVNEAIRKFRSLGYSLHVVTNQPDVDDGYMTEETLNLIHDSLKKETNIDTIQSARTRGTEEYKPNPGMLNKIIKEWMVSKERSWMIGDTWRDVVAGHRAGVKTIYLGGVYEPNEKWPDIKPDYIANNLIEAANIIEQNIGGR